jgi:hypothetical protein
MKANQWLESEKQSKKDLNEFGFDKSKIEKLHPTLF